MTLGEDANAPRGKKRQASADFNTWRGTSLHMADGHLAREIATKTITQKLFGVKESRAAGR